MGEHYCPWDGCAKVYKRQDHLERHVKTHSGDLNYRCHVCERQYSRSDVLNRHLVQTHGERPTRVGRPRQTACMSCVSERVACDGVPPRVCSRCRLISAQCRYKHLEMEARRSASPARCIPDNPSPYTSAAIPDGLVALGNAAETMGQYDISTMMGTPVNDYSDQWLTDLISNATNTILPGASLGLFDFSFPQPDLDFPAQDEDELRVAVLPSEVDGRPNHPQPFPDGRVESVRHSPERDITLPALGNDVDSTSLVQPFQRQLMQSLTRHAHSGFWAAPDLTNFPSESTLSHCISLYLSHFAAWLPIVDSPRGNLIVDKSAPLLLKSLTVIGSIYARDDMKNLGPPLAELVRRNLLFICEHDQRFTYDVGVVQSTLLQAYFNQYMATRSFQAEVSRATIVAAARQMHLLSGGFSAFAYVRRNSATIEDQNRALMQDHRRGRLGWCIFLFDTQMTLQGRTPLLSLDEIDAPLPTYAPEANLPPFADVMTAILEGNTPKLDDVGFSCVAHALYRINRGSPFQSYTPEAATAALARLASHALRLPSSALLISVPALAYHSAMSGVLKCAQTAAGLGNQSQTQASVGALVELRSQSRDARSAFANAGMLFVLCGRFVYDTPIEPVWLFDAALVLSSILHYAPTIFDPELPAPSSDLYSSPSQSYTEPGLTPDLYSKSISPTHAPLPLPGLTTITYTSSSALKGWIEHGGNVTIQGLGSLSAEGVLRAAADRLDVLSWGVAGRYRHILLELVNGRDWSPVAQ